MAFVVGCTGEGVGVVPIEVNLDIVHPDGSSSDPGFSVDRVDYRVTCPGTSPGTFPIPPAGTGGTDYGYNDSVDMAGAFEIVDTRIPPVWQAAMGLPPGICTMTLLVYDEDEVVCVGSKTLTIVEGVTTKFDIILVCALSVDLPSGGLDVDPSIDIVIGNWCPQLHSLIAIPSTVDIHALPPRARIEYRSIDQDGTCGLNCKPETCTSSFPPVCSPSVYNPADPRCNPLLGGSPLSAACQSGIASGLVCTLKATPTATAVPGGWFVNPVDGTTLAGPILAINLDDFAADGTGVAVPGVDVFYQCDPSIPGSVTIDLDCGDGDPICNRTETITVICPGQNFCDSNPIDCSAPSDCTADGLCDAFCDPATTCNRCPGRGAPLPSGTLCSSGGGNVCNGTGSCVQCVNNSLCDSSPLVCREPSQCVGNVCQPRAFSPVGTPCNNGACNAAGVCQFVAIDPPAATRPITLACTSSVSAGVSILPFNLSVDPTAIVSSLGTSAALDGVAQFSQAFLDAAQAALPGGVTRVNLVDLKATVHLRAGGAGSDVTLSSEAIAYECAQGGAPCNPANDLASVPGSRGNTDCVPTGTFNACGRFIDVPISTDCAPTGVCAGLGKLSSQCALNGFCVAGSLPLPLQGASGTYSVAASGQMRFGWDDASTGATVGGDGTWTLPAAVFGAPTGPNGLRVNAGGLSVALQCTMGVASDDPAYGVGVAGKSSPTPDSLLVTFPIQVP
jgi:hypothetical protein